MNLKLITMGFIIGFLVGLIFYTAFYSELTSVELSINKEYGKFFGIKSGSIYNPSLFIPIMSGFSGVVIIQMVRVFKNLLTKNNLLNFCL